MKQLLLLAALIAVAGCGGADAPAASSSQQSGATGPAMVTWSQSPLTMTGAPTSVTFTLSPEPTWSPVAFNLNEPDLDPRLSWSFAPSNAGVGSYSCTDASCGQTVEVYCRMSGAAHLDVWLLATSSQPNNVRLSPSLTVNCP